MSTVVVPDSIEPYIGWKALQLDSGFLYSPQQHTKWHPQYRLEAFCDLDAHHDRVLRECQWVLRKGQPPDLHPYTPGEISDALRTLGTNPLTTNISLATNTTTTPILLVGEYHAEPTQVPVGFYWVPAGCVTFSDPPATLPPEGHYWAWEESGETEYREGLPFVSDRCTCGIYVVNKIDDAHFYLRQKNAVLAKVALWGRVVVGSKGARGEYAYPQEFIFPPQLRRQAAAVSERYGVPYEIKPLMSSEPTSAPAFKREMQKLSRILSIITMSPVVGSVILGFMGSPWMILPLVLATPLLVLAILASRAAR